MLWPGSTEEVLETVVCTQVFSIYRCAHRIIKDTLSGETALAGHEANQL